MPRREISHQYSRQCFRIGSSIHTEAFGEKRDVMHALFLKKIVVAVRMLFHCFDNNLKEKPCQTIKKSDGTLIIVSAFLLFRK